MRGRLLAVLIIMSITAVVLAGCAPTGIRAGKERSGDTISCRLKWLHQAQFAGLYVAQARGFFEQAGINCTLRPGGQDFNVGQLVAAGSDDFGVWSADQVLLARSQGVPIVAVGVIYQESPVCFFSRKDSGIKVPQDFIGKKVGMQYGTNVRTEYVAMMKHVGLDMSRVTEVPSRFDLRPFLSGEVDVWNGYTINEPLVAESLGVPVHLIRPSDYGVDMYADCLIATETTVRDRPDLVRRFVASVIRGWEYALAHREEALRIVLDQDSSLREEHERMMLDESARLIEARSAGVLGIGRMDEKIWRGMLEEIKDQGQLGPHPVTLSEAYTNQFLPRSSETESKPTGGG